MSKIRIDEASIEQLVDLVEDFDELLKAHMVDYEQRQKIRDEINDLRDKVSSLERDLSTEKNWRSTTEGKATAERAIGLDERENELIKRRKDIEDLAYNKGYVAGYVEITQKLGKQS